MKRNLLLLAVTALMVFGFSSVAVAQDPGTPDTLYLELYPGDDSLFMPGPWLVQMPLYIWHDLPDVAQDSLAGIVVPLFYTSTNTAAKCSTTAYNNDKCLTAECPPLDWVLSIFRNLPELGETNWMWDRASQPYPNTALAWDTRIMDLGDFVSHWWLTIATSGSEDQRMWEGTHILLATMTFKIQDSTTICVDTGFWFPSSRLQFGAGVVPTYTYIPQFQGLCVEAFIVPNIPPTVACPSNQSYNTSGTKTVTGVTGTDADGIITGATATLTTSCGQVSNVQLVNEAGLNTASYTADVQFDVNHCAQCTDVIEVTVNDDGGASAKCTFDVTCTNTDPTVEAGGNKTGAYNVQLCSDAIVTGDDDGDAVTWGFTVDPIPGGTMQKVGDKVCFDATCADVSITYTVTVTATDVCGAEATDAMTMHVTNLPPSCDIVDLPASMGTNKEKVVSFTYTDPEGELLSNAFATATCGAISEFVDNGNGTGSFKYTAPPDVPVGNFCVVCVTVVDDCGILESECCDSVEIVKAANQVIIPNYVYERFNFGHWDYFCWQEEIACDNEIICDDACPPYGGVNPGAFVEIPIILNAFQEMYPIGGFELEIDFDYIDLTFYGAMRGGLLERRVTDSEDPPVFWSWEYFTYRVLPSAASHQYKILLFGQADMPDGPFRRGYCLHPDGFDDGDFSTWWYEDVSDCDTIGATLAWLKFQVANNELLRDLKLPVIFEWEHKLSADTPYVIIQDWDCAENTFSSCDGNDLYASNDPLEFNPFICGDPDQNPPLTILDFVDGGIHVCSPCTSFKCVRGDINLDHIAYTTADAVLFARYFVEGIHVFVIDMDEQVCATDVNADGRTLTLSDLIYLIRVILRDAPEIGPKLGPSSEIANVIVSGNTITTECASPIGAILFEFDGAVQPTLLANMEMVNKGNKVLVWSRDGNTITTAEVLSFTGDAELVSVTAVDRDSRELQTSITAKVAPTAFALNPAYPNPFNPFTNLSFTLPEAMNYSLKIYNVAGQLVRSYEGMGVTGLNVVTWDGKDYAGVEVASGVYFYKLTAAGFTATQKMVMMK